MTRVHRARWCVPLFVPLFVLLPVLAPLSAQTPAAPRVDACALVSRASLSAIRVPRSAAAVPDSGGVFCRWGDTEAGYALAIKLYPSMPLATIERMHIAASKIADPIFEPTLGETAWSMGTPFGRVIVAGRHGKAVQLKYYVPPHSKGADRVDHRATAADRENMLVMAKAVLSRL
jgi:hypothetical protein